jgi:hypothetical protein
MEAKCKKEQRVKLQLGICSPFEQTTNPEHGIYVGIDMLPFYYFEQVGF